MTLFRRPARWTRTGDPVEMGPAWSVRRQATAYAVLVGGALVFIIPFWWMFSTSLSLSVAVSLGPPLTPPRRQLGKTMSTFVPIF